MNTPNQGFTLVEIIVVVAVIGVLSLVAFASFEESRKKARDTARFADLEQIKAALVTYGATFGEYPDDLGELESAGLFHAVPTDPVNEGVYVYSYADQTTCFDLSGQSERTEEAIEAGNCPD